MKKVIILFGKPGAGKGTRLGEFLEGREEQYDVLSVGNLLRKARKEQTEIGKKASKYMDAGELVPNEIINEIVIEAIKKAKNTVITDGFPRTVGQAEAMLEAGVKPDIVINLYVDDKIVLQRAKVRIVCEGCGESYTTNGFKPPIKEGICNKCGKKLFKRNDDNEEVVKNRLLVYEEQTYPVLEVLKAADIRICTIYNDLPDASEKFKELLLN